MFDDLFPETIDKAKPGTEWWAGHWQCRNWNGFFQSREDGRGLWQFYVEGFGGGAAGEETTAYVARIGAGDQIRGLPCPIDSKNRITILGRTYGRNHWTH